MKHCLFQYWSGGKMIVDTELITKEEANELFVEYSDKFRSDFLDSLEPVMALWINNAESSKYQECEEYWDYQDFMSFDGDIWRKV